MQPDDGQHTQPNMKKTTLLLTALASLTIANYGLAFETAQNTAAIAITSLPAVISSPGNYYLASPFTVTAVANTWQILITASNVTLDLNNQTLPNTILYGVCISGGTNVTVQNGNIGSYGSYGTAFSYPLYLQNARYCTIKNITTYGVYAGMLDSGGIHDQFHDSTFEVIYNGQGSSLYLYNCGNDMVENCTLIAGPYTWGAYSYGGLPQFGGNVFRDVNISFETTTPPYYGLYLKPTDLVKGAAANAPVNVTFIYGTANVVD
jgi:hypothetical protein